MRKFTDGEIRLIKWQFHIASSFVKALFHLIIISDDNNKKRLSNAFPEEVSAYVNFSQKAGYWTKLVDDYNEANGTHFQT